MSSRAEREAIASDQSNVYDNWHKMNARFRHVYECPNTVYYQRLFDNLITRDVVGKRALEIGCGAGGYSEKLFSFGAAYVLGTDISRKGIARAKTREIAGKLEYSVVDVSEPIEGVFNVIVGRAVLHHLDYKDVLKRLYQDNLSNNGLMIFWEPLGSNWLIRAYHALGKSLHTPDERPFYRGDLRWLAGNFPDFRFLPVNYLSLPFGIVSSFIFASADNVVLRVSDRADRLLARKAKFLHANFRNAIFVIRKPSYQDVSIRSQPKERDD